MSDNVISKKIDLVTDSLIIILSNIFIGPADQISPAIPVGSASDCGLPEWLKYLRNIAWARLSISII
jgi:hypothetical protein